MDRGGVEAHRADKSALFYGETLKGKVMRRNSQRRVGEGKKKERGRATYSERSYPGTGPCREAKQWPEVYREMTDGNGGTATQNKFDPTTN